MLALFHRPGEFDARFRILLSITHKIDIGDNSQHIILVFFEIVPGVLVCGAKQDLRAGAHAQVLVGEVDPFRDQPFGLVEDLGIDQRQVGRIKAHIIFHQDDHLHPDVGGILLHVDTVFQIFDNADQDAVVALPDEHPVEPGNGFLGEQGGGLAVVIGEQHDGHVEVGIAHHLGKARHFHILNMRGGNDQVEALFLLRQAQRLHPAGDPGQFRGMAQVQPPVFFPDQFVEPAVFFEQIKIV